MTARRQKNKSQHAAQLNRQLEQTSTVSEDKKLRKRLLQKKMGENFFSLGNLVAGGILIAGIFEEVSNPVFLFSVGSALFLLFYASGMTMYYLGTKK